MGATPASGAAGWGCCDGAGAGASAGLAAGAGAGDEGPVLFCSLRSTLDLAFWWPGRYSGPEAPQAASDSAARQRMQRFIVSFRWEGTPGKFILPV